MTIYKLPVIKSPGNKYDIIQVYRFIAALMVIILHSTFYTSERLQPGFPLYFEGVNGIRLFFAISGFVMIISSENLKEKPGGWRIFAIKRIIRIVPIYWITTTYKLIVLVVASSLVHHARIDTAYILKSYFFIPAMNAEGDLHPLLGVGWTLNLEMFFYLMFTIALFLRVNTIAFLSMIFIPLAIISIFKTPDWPDAQFYMKPMILDFLYGMIAAKLILRNKKLPPVWAIIIIISALLYLFLPAIQASLGIYGYNDILIGLAAFLVVYGGASLESLWGGRMPAWLIYLGGASYSLYLIHPIVAPIAPAFLKWVNIKWAVLSVVLSTIVAIIAGTLFYKFCEEPLRRSLSKWAKKRKLI